ncbi:hypothetical protein HHL17_16655 [Chitinophaga sp. G-6-1-13]|uniref:Uncharacterized protein n=1 Tax=Chitinophaga fulva TaxID=2728842 RepID=A0A848GN78_9BACT|nr:hypothetical protein [Chitinophaga fulva]NML38839.1 hypothetical protein [Chitinophaga fulva]
MTVHNLINLMGTKSTDPAISQLFETFGLGKPPKTVNANQGDKGFKDKLNNLKFGFKFNITNDRFYPPVSPKKDDYNFECYMHSVVLYSEDRKKAPDPKPAAFWEGFIHPSGTYDDCLAFFGQEKFADPRPIFEKQVSDIAKVMVWMSQDGSRITDMELRLDEAREIFSQYDFNDSDKYNTVRQAYTLLVKWLLDSRFLILPEEAYREPLNTDHAAILDFTGRYLKRHIWDTQLIADPVVISFLYHISSNRTIILPDGEKVNVYIKNLYIKVAGKAAQRQELYDNSTMDEVDALERSLWLDEAQCEVFLQTLSETFALFKQRVPEERF